MRDFFKWILTVLRLSPQAEENKQVSSVPSKPRIEPKDPTDFQEAPSPNYSVPRSPRKIQYIIIHATAGNARGALAWMTNRESAVSAHYLIDKKGKLYRLVKDRHIAWHAGYGSWKGVKSLNSKSIGIELENLNDGKDPYPKIQLEVLMDICVYLCSSYRIDPDFVLRHSDVDPERKTDPGDAFQWHEFRKDLRLNLKNRQK